MANIPPAPEAKWGPGAEQDRYANRFGTNPPDATALKNALVNGPGAEQDRYGDKFGVKEENTSWFSRAFSKGSGAEQDRHSSHLGLRDETADRIKSALTSGPGAEQDRYASHWGWGADAERIKKGLTSGSGAEQDRWASHWGVDEATAERIKNSLASSSGAEQDRYAAHWGVDEATAERIKRSLTSGPGAEQDRYASHRTLPERATNSIKQRLSRQDPGPGAEQDRYSSRFGLSSETLTGAKEAVASRTRSVMHSGAEQDVQGSHFGLKPTNPLGAGSVGVVGILQSTILPTFAINSGLSLVAYAGSRFTDRLDVKDTLRPLTPAINAWWMAVGRRMYYFGIPFSVAWKDMSYPEKLLLGGVTAQALKIFFQMLTRTATRSTDEPRYQSAKKEPKFWDKAALSVFLPEAVFQTIVALPYTLAFRLGPSVAIQPVPALAELAHNVAVFLFGSGFALQTISDVQLVTHEKDKPSQLQTRGAWSIVRHPNYLGDFHVYASLPLLLYSCGLLHPLALAAPVAQYAYLRYFSGDVQMEQYEEEKFRTTEVEKYRQLQDYKATKNAFWPKVQELQNPWYLAVAAVGVGCAVVERGVREYLLR